MKHSDWQQIERVLAIILESPEEERRAQIEQLCQNDPEIRTEVESLLTAHSNAASFLDVKTQIDSDSVHSFSLAGRTLGPYLLLEAIGHGGMGTVYRAERTDGRFQKQVAVKVVPAAMHFPELLRRFASEQQILATLEHPNIARLLDAGVSPEGIPYLVMEYVEGTPVTEYCRTRRLSTRQRLILFQAICSTVHYAHQHLVVHRDIKPANILVTTDGTPKLLDFGIAKLMGHWSGSAASATRSILNPMTPDYASPEQARGETITTATDIYSLGVILYELLTGQRPYTVADKSLTEAVRVICEIDPERPAVVLRNRMKRAGERAGREVDSSADLDAIVAKAMRKHPQQRYASAQELESDISRYLAGLPVSAHRGSFQYVASKFILRHKLAVASFLITVLLGAAGVSAVVWQARIAQRERVKAQHRFDQVRSLAKSLMFEIHDNIATLPGSTKARELLISRAVQYLDSLAGESSGDTSLQMELAAAYVRVGDLQGGLAGSGNLGDLTGALASYEKAHSILASVIALEPDRVDASQQLARLYGSISNLHMRLRHQAEGLSNAEAGLAIWESLTARSSNDEDTQRGLAGAYFRLADAYGYEKDPKSVAIRGKALVMYESLLQRHPNDPEAMRNVALTHKTLSAGLLDTGRNVEAIEHLEKARELDQQRTAADANNAQAKLDLSFDLSEIAQAYDNQKQPGKALGYMQQTLDIRQGLADADPKDARIKGRVAYALLRMGQLHLELDEYASALPNLRSSIIINKAFGSDPAAIADTAQAYIAIGDSESGLAHAMPPSTPQHTSHLQAACSSYHTAVERYRQLKAHNQADSDDLKDAAGATEKAASCDKLLHTVH